jgi:hypothetical protein
MTELSPLIMVLSNSLDWNRARMTFLAQFIVAVIRVRTVNLRTLGFQIRELGGSKRTAKNTEFFDRFGRDSVKDFSRQRKDK